jgi:hypothetical protein
MLKKKKNLEKTKIKKEHKKELSELKSKIKKRNELILAKQKKITYQNKIKKDIIINNNKLIFNKFNLYFSKKYFKKKYFKKLNIYNLKDYIKDVIKQKNLFDFVFNNKPKFKGINGLKAKSKLINDILNFEKGYIYDSIYKYAKERKFKEISNDFILKLSQVDLDLIIMHSVKIAIEKVKLNDKKN